MPKHCRCRKLYVLSLKGQSVTYRCRCSKTTFERKITKAEAKKVKTAFLKPGIHKLYWEFCREFSTTGRELAQDAMVFKWKYTGYDLMERVARFQKKHPEILITRCDDAVHASSDLVFIPHKDAKQVWGITVLYIPQCTGENPITFFLYPNRLKDLLTTITKMAGLVRSFGNRKLDTMWEPKNSESPFSCFAPIANLLTVPR